MPLTELKDVRPPVDLPGQYFWLFVVLGFLVLLGLIVLAFWLKTKMSRQKIKPVIVRPPWEVAKEELQALADERLPVVGKTEEYFVRLSAVIRHYLERRFSVSAPEMTTDEFLFHINSNVVIGNPAFSEASPRHSLHKMNWAYRPELLSIAQSEIMSMPVLNIQQKESLKEFLTLSDMVKFARYHSTGQEMDEAMIVARRFIDETIPQPDSGPLKT